jgi:hypothetical protein
MSEYLVFFRSDCPHSMSLLEIICLYQEEVSRLSFELREVLTKQDAEDLLSCGGAGTPTIYHKPTRQAYEGDDAFRFFQTKRETAMMDKQRRGDDPPVQQMNRLDSRFKAVEPPKMANGVEVDPGEFSATALSQPPSDDHVKVESLDESGLISSLFDGGNIQMA